MNQLLFQRAKIEILLLIGYRSKGSKCRSSARGVFTATADGYQFELSRDEDARDLLANGETDMAFFGDDKLQEWLLRDEVENVEVIDTIPIKCRMVLAGLKSNYLNLRKQLTTDEKLTVATSYPKLLDVFADKQDIHIYITYTPRGSVEAYAKKKRTDLIFDICQSGKTLKANKLKVLLDDDPLQVNVVTGIQTKAAVTTPLESSLLKIFKTYQQRLKQVDGEATYTAELLADNNRMVKKFGEETAEFLQAFLLGTSENELVGEAADTWYAVCLMLAKRGISPLAVLDEDIARNNTKEIND